jgi:DnaJ-class molecular chaperone
MIRFRDIDEARNILGLVKTASLAEIKGAYRTLSLKYHPDKCSDGDKKICEDMFKKVNKANRILMSYCASYRYSFSEKEVKSATGEADEEDHFRRFYEDFI